MKILVTGGSGVIGSAVVPELLLAGHEVRLLSQPANVLDWMSMQMGGGVLQAENWREVVRRVVVAAGGRPVDKVQRELRVLDEDQARAMEAQSKRMVQERRRRELDHDLIIEQRDSGA